MSNILLSRFLDTVGDGSGTKNANFDVEQTDYPNGEIFSINPGASEIFSIALLTLHIEDTGSILAGTYGAGTALSNGITARVNSRRGVMTDLTDGVPILTNADWGRYCYDVSPEAFGTGNNYFQARWSFYKSGGNIVLDGSRLERLEVVLGIDDFSPLVQHYFHVQGFIRQGG